jgi:hypothetical protein
VLLPARLRELADQHLTVLMDGRKTTGRNCRVNVVNQVHLPSR